MTDDSALRIGIVTRVEGSSVEAMLTGSAMMVEHAGEQYRVGQLGSYVVIPLNGERLVGFVTGVDRREVGVVETRWRDFLRIQLLGVIREGRFSRGVHRHPGIGDEVWIAVREDFKAIFGSMEEPVEAESPFPKSFRLGRFALNPDFEVRVLGKEFFSKHVAILGNSGSGKSCAAAKIIHESLRLPEAQIVLFDLHGEYAASFCDEFGRLEENVTYLGEEDLVLPYWLLRYEELEALFVDKSNPLNVSNQITFLKTALLKLKAEAAEQLGLANVYSVDSPIYFDLQRLLTAAYNFNEARYILNSDQLAFAKLALRSRDPKQQHELLWKERCEFNRGQAEGETPHPTYYGKLLGLINSIEARLNDRRYDFMFRPVEQAKKSRFFRGILHDGMTPAERSAVLGQMLRLLTGRLVRRTNLTIVDLSGVPHDVIDIVVATLTRLLFEFNFWTPRPQRKPIVLVYEEAHNYIPRERKGHSFAALAVERVAKEGRKYGVSAIVVSQRPSELSETVLSQCNNMLVMRLNNPDDQEYITKVISDQFAALVGILPVLSPGEGFVIGDSVIMPMRTLIDLPPRLPRSGDVDFFRLWSEPGQPPDVETILQFWWRQDRRLVHKRADEDQSTMPVRVVLSAES